MGRAAWEVTSTTLIRSSRRFGPLSDENAIDRPSGDHVAGVSVPIHRSPDTLRTPLPSALATYSESGDPSPQNATFVPSGEKVAAAACDAGADLTAAEDVELGPGERALVRTGIAIALPDGYAAFVHPRSGLAAKHGVTLVNAPGTVDAGYRGEIKVTLLNTDRDRPVSFSRGDRIAQLVIQRVERALFHEVTVLPGSSRGDGGFGSTGGHNGNRAEAVS